MQKVTVLVLFISGFVILASAQVLAGRFFNQADLQTSVLTNDDWEQKSQMALPNFTSDNHISSQIVLDQQKDQSNTIPFSPTNNDPWILKDQTVTAQKDQNNTSDVNNWEASSPITPATQEIPTPPLQNTQQPIKNTTNPTISFSLLLKSGFNNISLQRDTFSGKIFERLEIKDFIQLPVFQQNVIKNQQKIVTIYEFENKSVLLASQIYQLLEENFSKQKNLTLNETNAYGEASFYVNDPSELGVAFLVVKKTNCVYALAYRKEYHPFIMKLIQLLP